MREVPTSTTRRRRTALATWPLGLALVVSGVLPGHPARAGTALRPIVFVHGGSGSGAQYETQAMRFATNGYPASYVRVHEYDSSFSVNTTQEIFAGLDQLIADLLAETGADRIDLLGHSLGTALMQGYLNSSPERAATVAHYVNIDGAQASAPPGGVPTLAIWGTGNPARQIVGAKNVYFPNQTHVQVATSAESFAEQYEFFTGAPPATTDILPEPRVQLAGRAVIFPENTGVPNASLEVFEVDGDTGSRRSAEPEAVYPLTSSAGGAFGPLEAVGGRHYEFVIVREGARPHHFYPQPVVRSDHVIRLLTVSPDSPFVTNVDVSDGTSAMVITRYREFWGDQGADNDVLTLNGFNVISPTNSPISKRVNAMFVFDDDLDGVNDIVTPNPFYFILPFITAMDVVIPAADPPTGAIRIANTSRGGLTAAINVPNWSSSKHAISVILHPHVQPTAVAPPLSGSRDELKCETGTSKALARFVRRKGRCVQRCLHAQRKLGGPYADCSAPYGGATAACISDATKGARPKAEAAIGKACARACPSCYAARGSCPAGAGFLRQGEANVDATSSLVHCLEAGGVTPTRAQARCEDAVAKGLVKFGAAKSRCHDKCVNREFKAKIPPLSCTAGNPSDADTQACLQKAEGKAAEAIDRVCEPPGAKPACYGPPRDSGADWVALAENLIDGQLPQTYCNSSPSGAFVD